jgi:hypothetical protein
VSGDGECFLNMFDVAGVAIICRRFQESKSREAALPIGNSVSIPPTSTVRFLGGRNMILEYQSIYSCLLVWRGRIRIFDRQNGVSSGVTG